ncbi:MAG TPA: HlyD family efflux transporter periplasmic adaptor subunit [Terriglobales bacterium]|nr:HlyD family efflux transporter periplasmic adaptor subunit [Terriglobales bacterium]
MKPIPRVILVLAVVVIAILVALPFLRRLGQSGRLTASGTIEATEAQLGFQAPGRIDSVLVREGDIVRAGQRLATLDRTEATARRAQAAAALAAARAQLDELQRGSRPEEIVQARAARDAARQRLADAQQDYDRLSELIAKKVVSQQAFDKASTALDVAKAQAEQAAQQYRLVVAGPRRERVEAGRAQAAQADAALRAADAQLANMVIRAPFDGVVTVRNHEPGEIVPAGAAVVTVLDRNDRWVRIYVSEDRIGAVHAGQAATITSDTFRGRTYPGTVTYISSEAEFTPKNVQTSEERVKLVYAVKVRVTGDARYDLKPGLPADVRLTLAK